MDWQPIETAPKDGTAILVWWEGDYFVARWQSLWQDDNMRWLSRHASRDKRQQIVSELGPVTNELELAIGLEGPTHWAPIPAPPASASPRP